MAMIVATLELAVPVAMSVPPKTKGFRDAGNFLDRVLDFLRCGVGAVHGGAVRQTNRNEERALVFIGQKSGGQLLK